MKGRGTVTGGVDQALVDGADDAGVPAGDVEQGGTDGGSQVLGLLPAQGGFVETVFPEAGRYPVVSHLMVDAERGAHGYVQVTG